MNWDSWSDFLRMGGYGPYVWGSLGVMVLAMAVEVWQVAARRRALRQMGASMDDDSEVADEAED